MTGQSPDILSRGTASGAAGGIGALLRF